MYNMNFENEQAINLAKNAENIVLTGGPNGEASVTWLKEVGLDVPDLSGRRLHCPSRRPKL